MLIAYSIAGIPVWLLIGTVLVELVAKYDYSVSTADWVFKSYMSWVWPVFLLFFIPALIRKVLFGGSIMR